MTILIIGPINSGKSSLIKRLEEVSAPEYKRMPHTFPTTGLNITDVRLHPPPHVPANHRKQHSVTIRELGGVMYNLWTKHSTERDIEAIVFVIDASNREFFSPAHIGLYDVLTCGATAPMLLVFNKADLCGESDVDEYKNALRIDTLKQFASQDIDVIRTSVKTMFGVEKLNQWIFKKIHEAEVKRNEQQTPP